jgi:hypothetical protein
VARPSSSSKHKFIVSEKGLKLSHPVLCFMLAQVGKSHILLNSQDPGIAFWAQQ